MIENNAKPKILLLEDYPDLIPFYRKKLIESGFEVLVESDEDEGIKLSLQEMPNLIIFDISLPETEDFNFIKQVKKNPKLFNIPMVILSDLSAPEDVTSGLAAGAAEYFVRDDFTFAEVIDRIKEIISKKL
jgi:two-component system alkaline phosphatase synthesis response regulator PhoP